MVSQENMKRDLESRQAKEFINELVKDHCIPISSSDVYFLVLSSARGAPGLWLSGIVSPFCLLFLGLKGHPGSSCRA